MDVNEHYIYIQIKERGDFIAVLHFAVVIVGFLTYVS